MAPASGTPAAGTGSSWRSSFGCVGGGGVYNQPSSGSSKQRPPIVLSYGIYAMPTSPPCIARHGAPAPRPMAGTMATRLASTTNDKPPPPQTPRVPRLGRRALPGSPNPAMAGRSVVVKARKAKLLGGARRTPHDLVPDCRGNRAAITCAASDAIKEFTPEGRRSRRRGRPMCMEGPATASATGGRQQPGHGHVPYTQCSRQFRRWL